MNPQLNPTQSHTLVAIPPVPSPRQLLWHSHGFYGFIHFGLNTFTDKEWGYGDEDPALFNPTSFDADQLAGVAADAGMAGLILTCKHHDGFCLWPSRFTEYSIKKSPWRNGQGDMVREVAEACRRKKIRFGVYLSPWDRNHPDYGKPEYITYYRNQLEELTTQYGEIFEIWFDGANGGDGYYGGARESRSIDRRTYYDWKNTIPIIRRNQPNAVIFSDAGPDVRWVGNEHGIAGDPCWSTLNGGSLYPGFGGDKWATGEEADMVKAWGSDQEMLNQGDRNGKDWLPAECDVSIRPGWFYHAKQDDKVRTPDNLIELYFKSVGRGASLLLNLPPDRRGLIHENDVASLMGFKQKRDAIFNGNLAHNAHAVASHTRENADKPSDQTFDARHLLNNNPASYWCVNDTTTSAEIVFTLPEPTPFNVISISEYLPLGQRVDRVMIDIEEDQAWQEYVAASAVGYRRLLRGKTCTTGRVRLRVEGSAGLALSMFQLHMASGILPR